MTQQEVYNEVNGIAENLQSVVDALARDIDAGAEDWQPEIHNDLSSIADSLDAVYLKLEEMTNEAGAVNASEGSME